ncbi:unnamed protein product, partial [Symbiodinium pilosum]
GTGIMRHLFEQFVTAGEDWQQTAIMMNIRHGEGIAQNIMDEKCKLDPNWSGKWVQKHPDQPENKDSESETEFDMTAEVGISGDWPLEHPAAAGAAADILGQQVVTLQDEFADALVADSVKEVAIMKGAYAALKEAVATGASDEKKLGLCADLTQAVQNFDAKMKT